MFSSTSARVYSEEAMGRNLFILAATLGLFALVSCGLSLTNVAQQPGSPGDTSLWRTTGVVLMALSLVVALSGVLSSLFEQAERRADEARMRERDKRAGRG